MKSPAAKQPEQAQTTPYGYNPVFEHLVDEADHQLVGLVAYGLYKIAKREWVLAKIEQGGLAPSENDYQQYADSQTATVLEGYRSQAVQVVKAYGDTVIQQEEPTILRSALKGHFWSSVWQSFVASVLFALALAVIVFIAAISGVSLPIQINLGQPLDRAESSASTLPNQ